MPWVFSPSDDDAFTKVASTDMRGFSLKNLSAVRTASANARYLAVRTRSPDAGKTLRELQPFNGARSRKPGSRNVTLNLYERHIKPLFLSKAN
jgi:hypothetical protein